MNNKLLALKKIAKAFNDQQITWAIGASCLLYFKGIVSEFNDLDIMISENDIAKVDNIMSSLGELYPSKDSGNYKSKYFRQYHIDDVDIDIIGGFVIVSDGIAYDCALKLDQINDSVKLDDQIIPLQDVSCWYRYYQLMKRADKVSILHQYYKGDNE